MEDYSISLLGKTWKKALEYDFLNINDMSIKKIKSFPFF